MNIQTQIATNDHYDWLVEHELHVSAAWVARCISLGEYRVATIGAELVGYLRHGWFWGTIPYMEMIAVVDERRRQGVGTALLVAWEAAMAAAGARVLMTSSVADELEPQAWHRRNGFHESGRLTFGAMQATPEVFLVKEI